MRGSATRCSTNLTIQLLSRLSKNPRPMVVSVHLLSLCTLFSRASLGTLHDAPGYEDRSSDLPVRDHTPATLRHLLRVRPSSSVSKNFPAADRRSDGGARR